MPPFAAHSADKEKAMSKTFTDTERLDWLLCHTDAEFHPDNSGCSSVVFWLGASTAPLGRPGKHIAKGESQRGCIDSALEGRVERLDC